MLRLDIGISYGESAVKQKTIRIDRLVFGSIATIALVACAGAPPTSPATQTSSVSVTRAPEASATSPAPETPSVAPSDTPATLPVTTPLPVSRSIAVQLDDNTVALIDSTG